VALLLRGRRCRTQLDSKPPVTEEASTAIRPEQTAAAEAAQHAAAYDGRDRVRVVAGPGTGKSSTVEERVRWLLADQRVGASGVFAVSFTRASARDLRHRSNSGRRLNCVSLTRGGLQRSGILRKRPRSSRMRSARRCMSRIERP
jgi:hypothetical protein